MLEAVSSNEALSLAIVEVGDYENLDPSSGDIRFEMFHEFARMDGLSTRILTFPATIERISTTVRCEIIIRRSGSRKTVITWAEPSSGW